MAEFGLIGRNIDYSFSRKYFSDKFKKEKLPYSYINFDIDNIRRITDILEENPELIGLNVTIPYKESIIPYLDKLSPEAEAIGAVNTIKVNKNKELIGYNTDFYGFKQSLKPLLINTHKAALILGTGGASKAIKYALDEWNIESIFVSRSRKKNAICYNELSQEIINHHKIIINTTPLGTFPNIESYPDLPYSFFTKEHLLYDLTYNPSETTFMKKGAKYGAKTINGYNMLVKQAEKAWEIWDVK